MPPLAWGTDLTRRFLGSTRDWRDPAHSPPDPAPAYAVQPVRTASGNPGSWPSALLSPPAMALHWPRGPSSGPSHMLFPEYFPCSFLATQQHRGLDLSAFPCWTSIHCAGSEGTVHRRRSTNTGPFHSTSPSHSFILRWPSEAGAGWDNRDGSVETGALFSNVHTANSLYNQGNGFSFRHLTLLSKENPALVPLWAEVVLSSVTDPSERLMGTGMGTRHGPPPHRDAQMS